MRWILASGLVFLLSGCAAPIVVTVASIAVDAGSYMVSGKTMSDHGLSLALDRDCAMFRALEEGIVCREEQDYEVTMTALAPLPEDGELDIALASGDEVSPRGPHFIGAWSGFEAQLANRDFNPIAGDYLPSEFIETER